MMVQPQQNDQGRHHDHVRQRSARCDRSVGEIVDDEDRESDDEDAQQRDQSGDRAGPGDCPQQREPDGDVPRGALVEEMTRHVRPRARVVRHSVFDVPTMCDTAAEHLRDTENRLDATDQRQRRTCRVRTDERRQPAAADQGGVRRRCRHRVDEVGDLDRRTHPQGARQRRRRRQPAATVTALGEMGIDIGRRGRLPLAVQPGRQRLSACFALHDQVVGRLRGKFPGIFRYAAAVQSADRADVVATALALAAGRGDRRALEDFVRVTQRDVWRYLAHLRDGQRADDLTQETYLRAIRSLPSFAGRSSARTWLLSIARKVAIDELRASAVRPRSSGHADWVAEADRAAPPTNRDDGLVELQLLLDELHPDRRDALVLTQIVGLSYAEAADVLGCKIGTVRSRVARARDDLVRARDGREASGTA